MASMIGIAALLSLPLELQQMIVGHLGHPDNVALSYTCQFYRQLVDVETWNPPDLIKLRRLLFHMEMWPG